MNITFVHNALESLGIEYLSASLKNNGHNVSLAFDPSIAATFRFVHRAIARYFSYENAIVEEVIATKPDLICFSVYSDNYPWACRIAQKLKQKIKTPIIFGGIHPTLVPELVINEPFVDYVCVGEGERAIVQLARLLNNGEKKEVRIENIWSKYKDRIFPPKTVRFIENLDDLPFPDKDLFYNEYLPLVRNVYAIVTSRSCVFKCSYCHNSYLDILYKSNKHRLRRRSISNVIDELVWAKKKYNIRRVSFFDDLFISQPGWLKDFLEEYRKRVGLPFFCTVHSLFLNRSIGNLLEKSGCSAVNMGVQTVSEKIRRDNLRRYERNIDIIKAIKLFEKTKIFLFTNVIFGLPDQDEEEMKEIIRFFNRLRPDFPDSNWLRYYPRTEIVRIAIEKSLLDKETVNKINAGVKFRPYSLGGHTRDNLNSKFRNVLSIIPFLPKSAVNKIIKYKLYNFFPVVNLRDLAVIIAILCKKLFKKKKNPYPHFSLMEIISFHWHYVRLSFLKKQKIRSML